MTRPTGKAYDLPLPKFPVGTKVPPFRLSRYQRGTILKAMIRSHIRTLTRLRKDGYAKREPGDSAVLSKHIKGMIRAYLKVVDTAYEIEIAGTVADGLHLGLHPVNGCYVGGGAGWSGMDFYYQLLWRAEDDKNHVVVLQPLNAVDFVFAEHFIEGLLK